jgi:hypothetical protein
MNHPYRENNLKEVLLSKGYVMFKYIKDAVKALWCWWNWDNFIYLIISIVVINLLVYFGYCIYGITFFTHTMNGCYVEMDKVPSFLIKRDVEWEQDNVIMTCLSQDCINKSLNSVQCEPQK